MELQIKSDKIDQLEARIVAQERQIRELQEDVLAKQRDRDSTREQINAQMLSPLHFLNDDSREQFWKLLDSCRDTIEARSQGKKTTAGTESNVTQELKVQIERLKGVIDVQAIDLDSAKEQIEYYRRFKAEAEALRLENASLRDEIEVVEHKNKE